MRVIPGVKADFEAFAAECAESLLRSAFLLTGSVQDAEDLTQETLLNVYRHWSKVSRAENRGGYVHRILVNRFISDRRASRTGFQVLHPLNQPEQVSGADVAASVSRRDDLARALASLTMRERAAVILRHYLDMTHAEIAAAMGTTESTARSTLSRGLKSLRRQLDNDHQEEEGQGSRDEPVRNRP